MAAGVTCLTDDTLFTITLCHSGHTPIAHRHHDGCRCLAPNRQQAIGIHQADLIVTVMPHKLQHTHHIRAINTLWPRHHGRHFADDTFKRIFLNENDIISIKISLKFVPEGPINNIPALVQIMAWRRPGDKPLSEAMMVSLLTHICVTRPHYVREVGKPVIRYFLCYGQVINDNTSIW